MPVNNPGPAEHEQEHWPLYLCSSGPKPNVNPLKAKWSVCRLTVFVAWRRGLPRKCAHLYCFMKKCILLILCVFWSFFSMLAVKQSTLFPILIVPNVFLCFFPNLNLRKHKGPCLLVRHIRRLSSYSVVVNVILLISVTYHWWTKHCNVNELILLYKKVVTFCWCYPVWSVYLAVTFSCCPPLTQNTNQLY